MRKLSIFLILFALGLSVLWGYLARRSPPENAFLVVQDLDRDLGDSVVGEYQIIFRITNTSDKPGRIIGLDEG